MRSAEARVQPGAGAGAVRTGRFADGIGGPGAPLDMPGERLTRRLGIALTWSADALGVAVPALSLVAGGPALVVTGEGLVCNPDALEETLLQVGRADDARVWFLVCLVVDLLVCRDWGDRRDYPRVDRPNRSHVPVRRADVVAAQAWARLQVPEVSLLHFLNGHFSRQAPSWPSRPTRRQLMLNEFHVARDRAGQSRG